MGLWIFLLGPEYCLRRDRAIGRLVLGLEWTRKVKIGKLEFCRKLIAGTDLSVN